nr:MAG TPA: hypothetical protein [Caudoviricetes sp.]
MLIYKPEIHHLVIAYLVKRQIFRLFFRSHFPQFRKLWYACVPAVSLKNMVYLHHMLLI